VKIDPLQAHIALSFKHTRPLIGCRFDPNGRYLFVSSEDETIQRFDLLTKKVTPLVGHSSWVRGMAFRPAGDRSREPRMLPLESVVSSLGEIFPLRETREFQLFSGDYHGSVYCFDATSEQPKPQHKWEAHEGWIRAVAVSPDGSLLATCGNDHLVKLWSTQDRKCLKTLKAHQAHVYNVAFHPQGKELVSADLLGHLHFWDIANGESKRTLEAKEFSKFDPSFRATIGGIRAMSFSSDGTQLACAGITNVSNAFAGVGNPLVMLIDFATAKSKQILKPKAAFQGTAWGVAIHPEGFIIGAGGGNGGQLWFWKSDDPVSFHTVVTPQNIRDLDLHPSGQLLATASSDGTVQLYRLGGKPSEPMKK
jgi:WD40 repeat protein